MKKVLLAFLILFSVLTQSAYAQYGTSRDTVTASAIDQHGNAMNAGNDILLYPNPAHYELNVIFDGLQDIKTIAVYNLIGKVVSVYRVTGTSAKLDVDSMPSGIYFIRFMDSRGLVSATRKFTHQ